MYSTSNWNGNRSTRWEASYCRCAIVIVALCLSFRKLDNISRCGMLSLIGSRYNATLTGVRSTFNGTLRCEWDSLITRSHLRDCPLKLDEGSELKHQRWFVMHRAPTTPNRKAHDEHASAKRWNYIYLHESSIDGRGRKSEVNIPNREKQSHFINPNINLLLRFAPVPRFS